MIGNSLQLIPGGGTKAVRAIAQPKEKKNDMINRTFSTVLDSCDQHLMYQFSFHVRLFATP